MVVDVRPSELRSDVQVVALSGRLDLEAADASSPQVLETLDREGEGVIVDMGGVDFISSAGLRMLLAVRKKADAAGKKMALIRAQPAVYKVFTVAALHAVFRFFDTEAEAIEAL